MYSGLPKLMPPHCLTLVLLSVPERSKIFQGCLSMWQCCFPLKGGHTHRALTFSFLHNSCYLQLSIILFRRIQLSSHFFSSQNNSILQGKERVTHRSSIQSLLLHWEVLCGKSSTLKSGCVHWWQIVFLGSDPATVWLGGIVYSILKISDQARHKGVCKSVDKISTVFKNKIF